MTSAGHKASPPSPGELQRLADVEGNAWAGDETNSVDEAEFRRLAALAPVNYDRVRKLAAEELGVRVDTLDREVARLRPPEASVGHLVLADPDPWEHPVDGAGLIGLLVATIRKHVVLPPMAAEAAALWVLHAHALEASTISPLLAVTSPTPECGKTTFLSLIGALVPRPVPASNITSSALFRAIEKWHPTMIIDEADTFLKDSDELRGIVNSGHNRTNAYVIRSVGDAHEPTMFSTWAPKAIALIGKLPPTLDSRSIHIELRRLSFGETIEPLRGDRLSHLDPLRRMAWRWAQDHIRLLATADPVIPAALRGRSADNWRPLLAIADAAGGDWPDRVRRAAEALSAGRTEQSAGVMLLDDVRILFTRSETDRLTSIQIVSALGRMEDRPWSEWKSDKPITTRQLARLLEPFGLHPTTIRTANSTAKGYLLADFADAFRRYPPTTSVTPSQAPESLSIGEIAPVTLRDGCYGSTATGTAENRTCDDVTDQNPGEGPPGRAPHFVGDGIASPVAAGGRA